MGKAESNITKQTLVRASQLGYRLFRNSVGIARHTERTSAGIRNRTIRYGLCTGSSDLIGWRTITITPEHVGQRVAVFVAFENKTQSGRATQEQKDFINAVNNAGGIAALVRDVNDIPE